VWCTTSDVAFGKGEDDENWRRRYGARIATGAKGAIDVSFNIVKTAAAAMGTGLVRWGNVSFLWHCA
jgi:hypothetical protein